MDPRRLPEPVEEREEAAARIRLNLDENMHARGPARIGLAVKSLDIDGVGGTARAGDGIGLYELRSRHRIDGLGGNGDAAHLERDRVVE